MLLNKKDTTIRGMTWKGNAFFIFLFAIFRLLLPGAIRGSEQGFALLIVLDALLLLLLLAMAKKHQAFRNCFFVWGKAQLNDWIAGIFHATMLLLFAFVYGLFFPGNPVPAFPAKLYLAYILLILGAALEEFFFRNFLLGLSTRLDFSLRQGALLSSLLFAGGHLYQGAAVAVFSFLSGLYLCWLLIRYRSILVCILCHGIYNLTVFNVHYFIESATL